MLVGQSLSVKSLLQRLLYELKLLLPASPWLCLILQRPAARGTLPITAYVSRWIVDWHS